MMGNPSVFPALVDFNLFVIFWSLQEDFPKFDYLEDDCEMSTWMTSDVEKRSLYSYTITIPVPYRYESAIRDESRERELLDKRKRQRQDEGGRQNRTTGTPLYNCTYSSRTISTFSRSLRRSSSVRVVPEVS
jgi:hypothetical protein